MGDKSIPFNLWRADHWYNKPVKKASRPSKHDYGYYFKHNISITTSGFFSTPGLKFCMEQIGVERCLFSIGESSHIPLWTEWKLMRCEKITPTTQSRKRKHGGKESIYPIKKRRWLLGRTRLDCLDFLWSSSLLGIPFLPVITLPKLLPSGAGSETIINQSLLHLSMTSSSNFPIIIPLLTPISSLPSFFTLSPSLI